MNRIYRVVGNTSMNARIAVYEISKNVHISNASKKNIGVMNSVSLLTTFKKWAEQSINNWIVFKQYLKALLINNCRKRLHLYCK